MLDHKVPPIKVFIRVEFIKQLMEIRKINIDERQCGHGVGTDSVNAKMASNYEQLVERQMQ